MTSAFFWQNSVSLCPASFCAPRPNLPVTPGVSSYFCIPVPYNEKDIYFVNSRSSCRSSVQLQFFSIIGWGIDLDYWDVGWFALEMNRDHSVVLRLHPSTAFQTLLLTTMATPFLLRDSCSDRCSGHLS